MPAKPSTPWSSAAPVLTSDTSSTVGASLRPDSASSAPVIRRGSGTRRSTENTAAASVGRGDRAEQHRELPVEPEQVVRADRDHGDADRDAERRERDPEPHRRPDLRPLGGETTFGEDQHERREAQRVRDVGVLEVDAEPGLAEQHAHQQVDQQAGETGAHREPDRQDRDQHHGGADQQDRVHLMRVEAHGHLGVVRGGGPSS